MENSWSVVQDGVYLYMSCERMGLSRGKRLSITYSRPLLKEHRQRSYHSTKQ